MADSTWYLQLFGSLRVIRGEEIVERFRSQKFAALLAYLALYPNRSHSRDELTALLWPESDEETGRSNLRTALASLRRQLEPEGIPEGTAIQAQGRTHVRLGSGIQTDVALFQQALTTVRHASRPAEKAQKLTEAANVYVGPLLPGIYEDWALSERDRLSAAYRDAVGQLSAYWHTSGDIGQALDWARRAITADPLSEEAHAGVIRLLMESGQTSAARRQYETLERILSEKLGVEPSAEVKRLLSSPPPVVIHKAVVAPPTVADSAPTAPPALLVKSQRTSLPTPLTRFFGREDELAALTGLLQKAEPRLITLTGPGGSGKTRLALETARRVGEWFPGGIVFVTLAEQRSPDEVPEAIADALGISASERSDPARLPESIIAYLRHSLPTLLVLDNLEHLLAEEDESDSLSELIPQLLQVESVSCLVTSRRRLLLDGEQEFPLLPLPTPSQPGTPERLQEFPSVQLFVSRAQHARADFQLTGRNAATVAALCDRLEGIPLAIELAAGWADTLTPAQMLSRLEHRFDLLVARRRDISPRHRTLRATVESSFQMLPESAQQLFADLAVFRGGWTLESAEKVTGDADLLDNLTILRERSLVAARQESEEEESGLRFTMLETLREFAAEQLAPDRRDILQRRHAEHFTTVAETADPYLRGAGHTLWLERLEREHTNLREALAWAQDTPEGTQLGLRLTSALWRFWMLRGHFIEGRRQLDAALTKADFLPDSPELSSLRASALHGNGCLARLQGDSKQARILLAEALILMRQSGDRSATAMCLQNLAITLHDVGEYEAALAGYEEALALRRELDDKDGIANVLNSLGVLALDQGDTARSRAFLEESIAIRRQLGQSARPVQMVNLAEGARRQGDTSVARRWFEEAIRATRQAGNKHVLATALNGFALVCVAEGRYESARSHFAESLRLFLEMGDQGSIADTLEGVARSLIASLAPAIPTARLLGTADALRKSTGIPIPPQDRPPHAAAIDSLTAQLGESAYQTAFTEGRWYSPEEAVKAALEAMQSWDIPANQEAIPTAFPG